MAEQKVVGGEPKVLLLADAVFRFCKQKNKTKAEAVQKILDYYVKLGIKDTKGLKKGYGKKIDELSPKYLCEFINTIVNSDFPRESGWRSQYKLVKTDDCWQFVNKGQA